jgi:hypothetical protein
LRDPSDTTALAAAAGCNDPRTGSKSKRTFEVTVTLLLSVTVLSSTGPPVHRGVALQLQSPTPVVHAAIV